MREANPTHQFTVEAAVPTMLGRRCPKTAFVNVGRTDRSALAGGRI